MRRAKNAQAMALALGWLLLTPPAGTASPAAQEPAAPQVAMPDYATLREGTEVPLQFAQTLRSQHAVVGQTVELTLAEDLKVGDAVVARKGARVLGTVTEGKKKDTKRGHAEHLVLRVDVLRVGGRNVPLRGQHKTDAKRNKEAMVAGAILLGVSGLLLMSGKKFTIPEGSKLIAWVAEDVTLPVLP